MAPVPTDRLTQSSKKHNRNMSGQVWPSRPFVATRRSCLPKLRYHTDARRKPHGKKLPAAKIKRANRLSLLVEAGAHRLSAILNLLKDFKIIKTRRTASSSILTASPAPTNLETAGAWGLAGPQTGKKAAEIKSRPAPTGAILKSKTDPLVQNSPKGEVGAEVRR